MIITAAVLLQGFRGVRVCSLERTWKLQVAASLGASAHMGDVAQAVSMREHAQQHAIRAEHQGALRATPAGHMPGQPPSQVRHDGIPAIGGSHCKEVPRLCSHTHRILSEAHSQPCPCWHTLCSM